VVASAGEWLLKLAIIKLGLSARVYNLILKVAWTLKILAMVRSIRAEYFSEAVSYSSSERKLR
jgi:magnesium chelatase family protein